MYSNFARESRYVYLVNGNGEPLAIATFFETAPRLRRQFEREWKAELKRKSQNQENMSRSEIEQDAATHLLKRLARRLSPEERAAVGRLGLVSARLKMDENRDITVSERTVAMIGFEGIPVCTTFARRHRAKGTSLIASQPHLVNPRTLPTNRLRMVGNRFDANGVRDRAV
jgi:hypothetical protein